MVSCERASCLSSAEVQDPMVRLLWRVAMMTRPADMSDAVPFWLSTRERFAKLFAKVTLLQGMSHLGFRLHSLRRGGATAYFRRTGDLNRTIERGRWATSRVARLYIQDGLATEVENRLSPSQWRRLQREGAQVQRFLASI